jgi:hypothetical protein
MKKESDSHEFEEKEANFPTTKETEGLKMVFGPYRSHFLSKKSLIAAKNETKEERRK